MIRSVTCPKCGKTSNVPEHIASVRCSKCGKVWNPGEDAAAAEPKVDLAAKMAGYENEGGGKSKKKRKKSKSSGGSNKVAAIVASVIFVVALAGVGVYLWLQRDPSPQVAAVPDEPEEEPADDDDVVWVAPDYREVNMPEADRKRIYMDMRSTAITSIEKPLLIIGPARVAMEKTLQDVYDREIRTQAALHDVPEDDIRQIVNEGDAKRWDTRPRSNAKRNGKRLYPKSWSEGWKP
ncbi:zinc ribbon domain-containing protein [Crateriforma conspicua]|uniref:hypothetical protein n=1 Tax=Crateriforma conspicua TaxID=2527996 RepID=UPI00118C5519|nr:hypothetical protein [Crateriforma conspicua]QDV63138.1 hypothetical protein Mal65_22800 [Crateriforma conspicua]